jgi:hypothetical protein
MPLPVPWQTAKRIAAGPPTNAMMHRRLGELAYRDSSFAPVMPNGAIKKAKPFYQACD